MLFDFSYSLIANITDGSSQFLRLRTNCLKIDILWFDFMMKSYFETLEHFSESFWTIAEFFCWGDWRNHQLLCQASENIFVKEILVRNNLTMSLKDLLFLLMSLVALLMIRASSLLVRSDVRSSKAELSDSSWKVH